MVDADTGFGGPINAARTVQRYEQAGIAALHIEDQSTSSIRHGANQSLAETVWPSPWENSHVSRRIRISHQRCLCR
jgi:hypothetical protein